MVTQYLATMRIHRDKFEIAKRMLLEGHSQREVAAATHLSLPQVNAIAKILNIYVDVEEKKKEVERAMAELEKKNIELQAEIQKKSAEIEAYGRLGQEMQKMAEAKSRLDNELNVLRGQMAKARAASENYREELRDLSSRVDWLRQEVAKGEERLDSIRKLKETAEKDTRFEYQKLFRHMTYMQTLGPAIDSGLDRMASVLSFRELDKLMDLMVKKNPDGYEAWLKSTRHRSHDESSPHLATDGKKQYEVVATLEEDGWHMMR